MAQLEIHPPQVAQALRLVEEEGEEEPLIMAQVLMLKMEAPVPQEAQVPLE